MNEEEQVCSDTRHTISTRAAMWSVTKSGRALVCYFAPGSVGMQTSGRVCFRACACVCVCLCVRVRVF